MGLLVWFVFVGLTLGVWFGLSWICCLSLLWVGCVCLFGGFGLLFVWFGFGGLFCFVDCVIV